MTVKYVRIDKDIVEQITTFPEIREKIAQSEIQKSVDEQKKKLADMPKPKSYLPNATVEEKHIIDEWNIENSNKFVKENLQNIIDEETVFLDMLKAVE